MHERCPDCDGPLAEFSVPEALEPYAPGPAAALCERCLGVHRRDSGPTAPDFGSIDDAFPPGEAAIAIALLLGKADSIALNRADLVALIEFAENHGADVFLTLDRLAREPAVEPAIDLDRRRPQLQQLV